MQDEVKEPAHLGGMGTTSQASHSPADPASADPHANLGAKAILSNLKDDTSAPESALTPLYPLFTLAIYIPLSIAMHVFPSAHHPKAFVDYSLLAPAISLALVGSYRGRSSRSRTESGQSGRINSSTDGHKLEGLSEEDEGWEMHSLVQLLLLCAAYPIVSREQMWGGVTAAVWCVVILGWRPWCVSRGEGLGRNISGAVQVSVELDSTCGTATRLQRDRTGLNYVADCYSRHSRMQPLVLYSCTASTPLPSYRRFQYPDGSSRPVS